MKPRNNVRIYIYLVITWLVLIVIQYFLHRYLPGNLLTFAVDSLAPIPFIVLVVVFLVGLFMETREQKNRKQQLMFIKSCMFRLELRELYLADFLALDRPSVSFGKIRSATLPEIKKMREEADSVSYKSLDEMETVIEEYVKARDVWRSFLDIARENGFDAIFHDMLYILHFIGDVTTFRELNPNKLFIDEATQNDAMMEKVMKVLGDGIRKYLDYAVELKEKQPDLFDQMITDYELLARGRGGAETGATVAPTTAPALVTGGA
jgi:hypothetical protein